MTTRIVIVAPDSDLRHSLQFALAAEGFAVEWHDSIAAAKLAATGDCVVLDHHVATDLPAAIAYCRSAPPVILLANVDPHPLSPHVFRTVLKPMLGPALTAAIHDALNLTARR